MSDGKSYEEALHDAIYLYCYSEAETQKRMDMISNYDQEFGDLAGVNYSTGKSS